MSGFTNTADINWTRGNHKEVIFNLIKEHPTWLICNLVNKTHYPKIEIASYVKEYASQHPEYQKILDERKIKMSKSKKEAWKDRNNNGFGTRVNGALDPEVQEKIRTSIRQKWQEGTYEKRVNGMLGVCSEQWNSLLKSTKSNALNTYTYGKNSFHQILEQEESKECYYCGKTEGKLDCHHIDENHDNYLLSNLIWCCPECHLYKHHYVKNNYRALLPKVKIRKEFSFEYAHILPWHTGKCGDSIHGHSGRAWVTLEGRIDPSGLVEDYYELTQRVKPLLDTCFDHKFLNEIIENPTSENILLWLWITLEKAGVKGMSEIMFSETAKSYAILTKEDVYDALGWIKVNDQGDLVPAQSEGEWVMTQKIRRGMTKKDYPYLDEEVPDTRKEIETLRVKGFDEKDFEILGGK